MPNDLTDEELTKLRELLDHAESMIEVSKDREAMTRIRKKASKITIGAAAFIASIAYLLINTGEWMKKWLG